MIFLACWISTLAECLKQVESNKPQNKPEVWSHGLDLKDVFFSTCVATYFVLISIPSLKLPFVRNISLVCIHMEAVALYHLVKLSDKN